jgi:hypothetical protein
MTDGGGPRLERRGGWILLGTLGLLVALNVPELGSQAWPFHTGAVHPHGIFGPLVRAAHRRWDVGVIRSAAMLGGVAVAVAAVAGWRVAAWRRGVSLALALVVVVLLLVPAVLLQAGLRQATRPWFHVNDSTYQIELAGDLVRHGHSPYGHDFGHSGLARFYSLKGTVKPGTRSHEVALRHFAYFPGSALAAAVWRLLPSPLDDYRLFVLLASLGLFFAMLAFPAPWPWKVAAGAFLAANPLVVRGAWFGTADAPSLLFLVLAFALVARARYLGAAACLAVAVLFKQFALVALPFLAVALIVRRVPRPLLWRAAGLFAAVLAAGILPFLAADPGAFWHDTISYGAGTYRIIGYGLAALLLRAHVLHHRSGYYPFLPLVLLVWLPVTAWLTWNQLRSSALWVGAAAFTVSMFVLLFLGRVFQNSYLVWPLTGIVLAFVLASGDGRARDGASEPAPRP